MQLLSASSFTSPSTRVVGIPLGRSEWPVCTGGMLSLWDTVVWFLDLFYLSQWFPILWFGGSGVRLALYFHPIPWAMLMLPAQWPHFENQGSKSVDGLSGRKTKHQWKLTQRNFHQRRAKNHNKVISNFAPTRGEQKKFGISFKCHAVKSHRPFSWWARLGRFSEMSTAGKHYSNPLPLDTVQNKR